MFIYLHIQTITATNHMKKYYQKLEEIRWSYGFHQAFFVLYNCSTYNLLKQILYRVYQLHMDETMYDYQAPDQYVLVVSNQ